MKYPSLERREGVSGGRVCIRGTGIGAEFIAERALAGESVSSITADYGHVFAQSAAWEAIAIVGAARAARKTVEQLFDADAVYADLKERRAITRALFICKGVHLEAAALLRMSPKALRAAIKRLGIQAPPKSGRW